MLPVMKTNRLMVFAGRIVVHCENNMRHISGEKKRFIQGGPKVGIQYIVYSVLYTYFCSTLYISTFSDKKLIVHFEDLTI